MAKKNNKKKIVTAGIALTACASLIAGGIALYKKNRANVW